MSEEPAPKWGFECLACHQRVKPFGARVPVKGRPQVPQPGGESYSLGSERLLGFRHPGCSLKTA